MSKQVSKQVGKEGNQTNREAFYKRHNIDEKDSLSMDDIARLSGMPVRILKKVYSRGMGAYRTNPESVRPQVNSPQQWAFGRVYSFVMKQKGTFYGQDADLARML